MDGTSSLREESVITRLMVVNPSPRPVPLPSQYRGLFHGASEIKYGRHVFRFPIDNLDAKRLVSRFQSDFQGLVRVDFGVETFDEV
jgi:hypothetical protein